MDLIKLIELELGEKADLNFKNIQPGDVPSTHADIKHSIEKLGYEPKIPIEKGIPKFIECSGGSKLGVCKTFTQISHRIIITL